MEALELLDPQSQQAKPMAFTKSVTLKEYVMLDDNFIIIDEDLKQNFVLKVLMSVNNCGCNR